MPVRIAIVGSGISGLGAAYRLSQAFGGAAVSVFEKEQRAGGHSATVDIDHDRTSLAVDTGFIVYNEHNYPLLTALFNELKIETKPSDMGFSLSLDRGRYEWAGLETNPLRGFLAQKRNLVSLRHWRMLADILRFSRAATRDLAAGHRNGIPLERFTLEEYIAAGGWSKALRDDYLITMGAAIWSMPTDDVLRFPARSFLHFFDNHRLLSHKRPQWRTVVGGSRTYVARLIRASGHTQIEGAPVTQVRRLEDGVEITRASGETGRFDHVILACHSDEARAILADATPDESAALGAIRYAANDVWLHRDPALMPHRKAAWAAWNVLRIPGDETRPVTVSYWMNALQGIDHAHPVFVTLNPPVPPRADLTFGRFSYAHPQYDAAAIAAQGRFPALQGHGGVYFAGAWLGYGFHEDGLRAGYAAADQIIADCNRLPARQMASQA